MQINLFENYRVKIIVLTIATVFWFAVVTENVYEYDLEVPIVMTNLPPGKTLLGKLPGHARVRFEGRGKALFALLFQRDAKVVLDLAEAGSAPRRLRLQRDLVQVGRWGLPVVAKQILSPTEVEIVLGNLRHQQVAIKPAADIRPAAGFTVVGKIRSVPDSVKISGPENFVKGITHLTTVPCSARNLRASFKQQVALQVLPDSLHIDVPVKTVTLTADIQKLVEITLPEIPVQVKNAPRHLTVTPLPSTLSLTLEGGEQLLLGLKREDIVAVIDYQQVREMRPQEGYQPIIMVPEGVSYRNLKPSSFKLMLERRNHAAARH
ncbi:MAG: hypothetical protein ONB48_08085 [candidate division KSB1 bacterium]|nr:hypothetical protein [candidate division KSB1 bacterium]MDZ7274782.1 hypothetical protein [candidate division KSB1 bacterium]MDZ7285606.1 hypothetical protein [candidate division KSB1 bacterium]MDZ7298638.1 hypothetical protein [candidate division KSB1 bacterium]MDZ7307648.1 hypothetical protein [candidate division KSB1 bacterium]